MEDERENWKLRKFFVVSSLQSSKCTIIEQKWKKENKWKTDAERNVELQIWYAQELKNFRIWYSQKFDFEQAVYCSGTKDKKKKKLMQNDERNAGNILHNLRV